MAETSFPSKNVLLLLCQLGNFTFCITVSCGSITFFYSLIQLSFCKSLNRSYHACLISSFKTIGFACFLRSLVFESTSLFGNSSLARVSLLLFGVVGYALYVDLLKLCPRFGNDFVAFFLHSRNSAR